MITSGNVASGGLWTSKDRLYLDSEGNVVGEKDPNRASLLVGAGGSIPLAYARSLGLVGEKALEGAPENKAVIMGVDAQNKAVTSVDAGTKAARNHENGDHGDASAPNGGLSTLLGLGSQIKDALREKGIETEEDVRNASDEDLLSVSGIGAARLKSIREQLK